MDNPITGQCMCGSIKYTSEAEPLFSLLCQCTQCQKITGSGHSAQFAIDANKTKITGDVNKYKLTSDSGNAVESAFCPNCGNPIYKTTSMMTDTFVFHASTLDDPSEFKPGMVVFSSSGQPWDHIDRTLERKG